MNENLENYRNYLKYERAYSDNTVGAYMNDLNKYEEIYTTLDENKKGILNLDSTSKGVVFQPFDLIKEKEETKDELSEWIN